MNPIDLLLGQIGQFLTAIFQNLINYMGNVLGTVANYINQLAQYLTGFVANFITTLQSTVAQFIKTIQDTLANILTQITSVVQQIWQAMSDAIVGVIDKIQAFINQSVSFVQTVVSAAVTNIKTLFSNIADNLVSVVSHGISAIAQVAETMRAFITNGIDNIIRFISDSIAAVKSLAIGAVESVIGATNALIGSVNDRLVQLKGEFVEAAEHIVAALPNVASEGIEGLGNVFTDLLGPLLSAFDPVEFNRIRNDVVGVLGSHTLRLSNRDDAAALVQRLSGNNPVIGVIIMVVMAATVGYSVIEGVTEANAEVIRQEFAQTYHYQLMPVAEVLTSWRRGSLSQDAALLILSKYGFEGVDASRMFSNTSQMPAPGDTLAMRFRGIVDDTDAKQALKFQGFDEPWISRMIALSDVLPPVGDLITMAVREVFDPQTVAKFGQDQDFPETFAAEAQKQGLSQLWARRYWAAHWTLPSAEQGFEMLHRGVIDRDDLNVLLKALDVMPFWRDGLTKIAFNPFTRVDIRRMNALSILDEGGVLRAHLDLGYDEEKARLLTDFTLKLNRHAVADDDVELGKLTRGAILGFFEDGLINEQRAAELLVGIGHTLDAAQLYVQSVKHDLERKERKLQTDTILDMADAGLLNAAEAEDSLRKLGLETVEVERAVTKLARAQVKRNKLPSVEQGTKMFETSVIPEVDYRDLLSRLGYAAKWVEAFVALARKESSGGKKSS